MRTLVRRLAVMLALCLAATPAALADNVVVVAGGGKGTDGVPATQARLNTPFGVDFDRAGNMYIVEMTGARVLKVDRKGILTVLGGTGTKGDHGDGGPATAAQFNGPHSLAVAPDGTVYLADTWNNRVRKIDPKTGIITAFAGTGEKGFGGDGGPALKAKFGGVYCVALSPDGKRLYVADLDNRRVRAIDLQTGVVRTVAGNGKKGVPTDGADALKSPLVDPRAVAADRHAGNVYILERSGHALRMVTPDGKIRTVAGTGKPGLSGDGGPALKATLRGPKHLYVDLIDNVVIADSSNHVVRTYLARDRYIARVAGTGKKGSAGAGGPAREIEMNEPHGVYFHPRSGALYIADSNNHRVLKLEK
jgi:DNA-binding beta-propeller fold protein YncE